MQKDINLELDKISRIASIDQKPKQTPQTTPKTVIALNISQRSNLGNTFYSVASNGPGFMHNLSSSTLRHTSPTYSFPKGERFIEGKLADQATANLLQLPDQRGKRTCSFGFGKKDFLRPYTLRNARDNPSPDRYALHQPLSDTKRGKSFGISHDFYKKCYWPSHMLNLELSKELPPVGSYKIQQEPGQNKKKFALKAKGKDYLTLFGSQSPPCNAYTPRSQLVENLRFTKITFGKGIKYDFTKPNNSNPGPGTYVLFSPFDKLKKGPKKRIKLDKRSAFI